MFPDVRTVQTKLNIERTSVGLIHACPIIRHLLNSLAHNIYILSVG